MTALTRKFKEDNWFKKKWKYISWLDFKVAWWLLSYCYRKKSTVGGEWYLQIIFFLIICYWNCLSSGQSAYHLCGTLLISFLFQYLLLILDQLSTVELFKRILNFVPSELNDFTIWRHSFWGSILASKTYMCGRKCIGFPFINNKLIFLFSF